MSYRDILVQVDEGAAAAGCSSTAARLAERFSAHLTGVFLKTPFPSRYYVAGAYGGMPPAVLPGLIQEHDKAMDEAAETARMAFEAQAASAAVRSDWMALDADTPKGMVDCMRRTDLTILPRDTVARLAERGQGAADLALEGGGPTLLVPEGLPQGRLGRRILVAWNSGRESSRALRDAMPFIVEAEKVLVLTVAPHGEMDPDGLLQRHLERHGCEAEVIVDRSDDASAGQVLLAQAEKLDADLIVMGLYGRPRLTEMLLGGVSRDMLRKAPIPILVSH